MDPRTYMEDYLGHLIFDTRLERAEIERKYNEMFCDESEELRRDVWDEVLKITPIP